MFSIQNAVGKASGADCCGCRHIGQTKVSARLCFSVTDRFRLEDQRGVAGLRAQPPQTIAYQPAARWFLVDQKITAMERPPRRILAAQSLFFRVLCSSEICSKATGGRTGSPSEFPVGAPRRRRVGKNMLVGSAGWENGRLGAAEGLQIPPGVRAGWFLGYFSDHPFAFIGDRSEAPGCGSGCVVVAGRWNRLAQRGAEDRPGPCGEYSTSGLFWAKLCSLADSRGINSYVRDYQL
ncbi:MAG: hypothetical protein CMJ75_22425 [Planctomycetaceae bacterium]|nr:hypothetical protein [Planctomycetaceae bacterium]